MNHIENHPLKNGYSVESETWEAEVSSDTWTFATYFCVMHHYNVYYLCITLLTFGCGHKSLSIYSKVTLVAPRLKIYKNAYSCSTYLYISVTLAMLQEYDKKWNKPLHNGSNISSKNYIEHHKTLLLSLATGQHHDQCCVHRQHQQLLVSEWVNSFLTALQHNIGYVVPYR